MDTDRDVSLIELVWIDTSHPAYQEERALRMEVRRKPLGMKVLEVFPGEDTSYHLLAMDGARVVGCALYRPEGGQGRLYQMAVYPDCQRHGLGTRLVRFLEERLRSEGVTQVYVHARAHVTAFYEQLGFIVSSPPFVEVGIPHVRMIKSLQQNQ